MKFRLILLTGFAVFVAFILIAATFRSLQNATPPTRKVDSPPVVNAVTLKKVSRQNTLDFYGMVHPSRRWELSFQASGLIKQSETANRWWQEGDLIKKQETIATLRADREKAMVAASQAQIDAAEATLEVHAKTIDQLSALIQVSEAALDDSKTRVDDARLEIKRLNDLKEVGGSLQRERERAEVQLASSLAGVRQAEAQLSASKANLNSAKSQLTVLKTQVAQAKAMHQQNLALLNEMTIKAPDDVIVSQVLAEPGQMVGRGQPILNVHAGKIVHVIIGVPESRLGFLKLGQSASIHIDSVDPAGNQPYAGTIKLMPPAANPMDGLFHIEISVDNTSPDRPRLLPGMTARVKVLLGEVTGYPIPMEAVIKPEAVSEVNRTLMQRPYVFMLDDQVAVKKSEQSAYKAKAIKVPLAVMPTRLGQEYLLETRPNDLNTIVVQGHNLIADGKQVLAYLVNSAKNPVASPAAKSSTATPSEADRANQ